MASVLHMEFPPRDPNPVFEKFHRELEEKGIWEIHEKQAAVKAYFLTDKEIIAYYDWTVAPLHKMIEKEQRYCPSRNKFFERLRNTNYRDAKEIFSLQGFCSGTHMPVMFLGHNKGIQYKLIPGNLLAEPKINWKDSRPIMHHNVLGINLHIEPKCIAAGRISRRSHGSDSHEFRILHQIGGIMFYDGDFSKVNAEADTSCKWLDTYFALASDVTSGKPGAVYLIYDFFPFIPNLDECKHIDNDYEWGFLPKDSENDDQFSCAKIADSLNDLNEDYEFQWGKRYNYEVELIPAVQSPDGTLDRQVVDEPVEAVTEEAGGMITPPSEEICEFAGPSKEISQLHVRTDSRIDNDCGAHHPWGH